MMTATDARRELMRLTAERLNVRELAQDLDASYLTELECEIDECRLTYEVLALTEIASLRAELFGPQVG